MFEIDDKLFGYISKSSDLDENIIQRYKNSLIFIGDEKQIYIPTINSYVGIGVSYLDNVINHSQFTFFGDSSNNQTKITIGGVTKEHGINADKLDGYHAKDLLDSFSGGTLSSEGNILTQSEHSIKIGGGTPQKAGKSENVKIINSATWAYAYSGSYTTTSYNLVLRYNVNGVESSYAYIPKIYAYSASYLDGKGAKDLFTFFGNSTNDKTKITIGGTTYEHYVNAAYLQNYHADVFLQRFRRTNNTVTSQPNQGMFPPAILELLSAGYPVYDDPEFAIGTNSCNVYNNSGGGTVTITRQDDDQFSANSSGKILKITTNGTASPGTGGFYQVINSRADAIFVQVFRAKIPVNYNVINAENSQGTNATITWLTERAGTGKWEWYARLVYCGNSGTFSSGGHVYLSGVNGASNTSVTWYISHITLIDITKGNYNGLRTRYTDNAEKIKTISRSDNSTHYITFVDSNNSPADYENLYTNNGIYFNPNKYSLGHGNNNDISGKYSHAEGETTQATGQASHTEGIDTYANSKGAHAEGSETEATGNYSHAEGTQTIASGQSSHAEGTETRATTKGAHAEGSETEATGNYSHSEGYLSQASGKSAHAEGNDTRAYGENSHAEGYKTIADDKGAHAEGSETEATGKYSHSEGSKTTASNEYAHVEGYKSNASGKYSHAEGNETDATNESAHSEGLKTKASGIGSHAEGQNTEAIGQYSHAEGYQTTTRGEYSKAIGYKSETSSEARAAFAGGNQSYAGAYYSFAFGTGISVSHENEASFGKYNKSNSDTIFSIGGGSSSNKYNLIEVTTSGILKVYNGIYFGGQSTFGTSKQPIYWNAGVPTPCDFSINASINSGTANRIAWYSGTNTISSGTITTDGGYLGKVDYLSVNTDHQTTYRLKVNGDSYINGTLETPGPVRITSTAGEKNILIGNQDSSGSNKPAIIKSANAALYFGTGTSWSGIGGTITTTLFLSGDNKVGIGTTSPSQKLHVSGGLLAITNNSKTLTIGANDNSYYHFTGSDTAPFYFSNESIFKGNVYPYTDLTYNLGTSSNRWANIYGGVLRLQGTNSDPSTSSGARIEFTYDSGNDRLQPVYISYTPNDSYREPAGLKIFGGTSATPAWLEVESKVYSNGFYHNGLSSNHINYVLTADGGYKQWSENATASTIVSRNSDGDICANYFNTNIELDTTNTIGTVFVGKSDDGYIRKVSLDRFGKIISPSIRSNEIITINKTLTVTEAWMDSGITTESGENKDFYEGDGTYIIQISHDDLGNDGKKSIYSGIITIFDGTDGTETEEIILHHASVGPPTKRLYIRIQQVTNSSSQGHAKIQIAASSNWGSSHELTFKFRKMI